MSETAKEPQKPAADKPKVGMASEKAKEDIPPGFAACYVAIPDCVSNGKGVDAKPGERIIGPLKSIEELELRGQAFRDESEAKAAFTGWKRKREKELEAIAQAEIKRQENKRRLQEALRAQQVDAHQWQG